MKIINNEKIKYILSILVVAVFFGFLFFTSEKKEEVISSQETNLNVSVNEERADLTSSPQGEEIIDEKSNLEICQIGSRTVFLDRGNKQYRTESKQSNLVIYAIFNEGVFYSWNNVNLDGKKFSLECMNSLKMEPDEDSKEEEEQLYEEFLSFDDMIKVVKSCKKYEKEVDFSYPENIKFHSYCELLKNQMEMLKK